VAAGRSAAHAELAAVLSAALSVKEVVEAVAASPTSTLGALSASIGIVDRSSALIRIEYAGGVGPSFASRALTVALGAPVPVAEAIRENRTVVLPDQRGLAGAYRPEVRWATPSQGGSVTVPLHGHQGSAIGCLTLVWSDSGTPDANDVGFIEETASLVGGAIERLVTAEREHRMATELQDRLLDLDRRTTAAVVAAVYQSASDALRVGGDWYTATTIDSDRIGISVGDVVGHGLQAVAAMSQLRSAVEAVALTSEDPRHVINVIERYAETLPGAMGATIGYAVVDRRSGILRYACAGHPYPLLVRPDGTTRFLEDGRRPALGLAGLASTSPPGQVQVSPGSLLILYTDGLVERRGESLDAGLLRLADTASGLVHRPAGEAATALLHKMAPDGGFSDDVALVALRPVGSNPSSFVEIVPAQVGELGPLRQRLRLWLESLDLAEDTVNDVLLGVGEATSNAIEHGSGFDPRRRVSLEAFADEHAVSVSVSDTGRWNRDSAKDHREPHQGLGLTLIHEVAADVVTVCTGSETRVSMSYRRSPG
jgi:anti-sigma regulatory factor (Ser/Thr protein kinase)